jgi:hypothetical protein
VIKNIVQFKTEVQGFECTFNFDQQCPIPAAKEAVFEALKWIGQTEDQIKNMQEQQKAAEEKAKAETEEAEKAKAVELPKEG